MSRELYRLKRTPEEVVAKTIKERRRFYEAVDRDRSAYGERLQIVAEQFDGHIKNLSASVLARTRLGEDTSAAIARELGWSLEKKEKIVRELMEYIFRKRRIKLERDAARLPTDLKSRIFNNESPHDEMAAVLELDGSKHTQYLAQLVRFIKDPNDL